MSNICTVTISGNAVTIQEGSLQIKSRVDDKDSAQFTVIDATGTAAYVKGQPVKITDSQLGLLFSGFLNKPTATNLFPSATTLWSVDCVNKFVTAAKKAAKPTSSTGKRHKGGKHKNQHSGTIVANQIKEYMEPEGVTGNFGLDWTELQSDWQSGTLSGVAATTNTSTGNVGAGDLELAPGGSQVVVSGGGTGLFLGNGLLFSGYCSSGYSSAGTYRQIWSGSQVISSASDRLTYDVWVASTSPQIKACVDIICSDGTLLSSTTQTDQQGLLTGPTVDLSGLATDTWYSRTIGLPSALNGKTMVSVCVAFGGANAGTYNAYFRHIQYSYSGGSITVFGDNSTLSINNQISNNGYSNVSLTVVGVRDKEGLPGTGFHTLNIGAASIVQGSQMSWDQTTPTPNGATILRETSIDNGASWQAITNQSAVPNLLAGMVVTGRNVLYRDSLILGTDPTATVAIFGPTLTVNSAPASSKTDVVTAWKTATDFGAGTLTNLVTVGGGLNGVTLNGIQRNYDDANYSNQTLYGSIGIALINKQLQLSANTSVEGRSRLDFAGQWQNFTAEVDFIFSATAVQCGFVYRTTGWQAANNTFAYSVTVNDTQVQFGRGTNTGSGGGTYTTILNVSLSLSVNSPHRLKIVVNGNNHQIFVDNVLLINQNDSTYTAAGYLGFRILNAGSGIQTGTFDNFGVAASLSGTWQSPSTSIASAGTYGNSVVLWDTDGLPDATTSITAQTSIDGGSTWQSVALGGAIGNLTAGQSLSGVNVIVKVTLAANNAPVVPVMNGVSVWVMGQYNSTGSRSNAPMVWDSMTRLPVISGWANASNGEAYTQTGTATTAVSANEATIANTTGDCHMVPAAPTSTDEDGSVRFQISASTMSPGMELRYVDVNNLYRFSVTTTTLTILKVAASIQYTLQTATKALSAGTWYWMRFRVVGSLPASLYGRVWLDGTTEPTTWDITASD